MPDQLKPAEMRGKAHALRLAARPKPYAGQMFPSDPELVAFRENVLAGADALDRLADVIEYTEAAQAGRAQISVVRRLARGDRPGTR